MWIPEPGVMRESRSSWHVWGEIWKCIFGFVMVLDFISQPFPRLLENTRGGRGGVNIPWSGVVWFCCCVAHKPQKEVSSLCAWWGVRGKAVSEQSQPLSFVLYRLLNYVLLGSRWVQKKDTKREEDERLLREDERLLRDAERMTLE